MTDLREKNLKLLKEKTMFTMKKWNMMLVE